MLAYRSLGDYLFAGACRGAAVLVLLLFSLLLVFLFWESWPAMQKVGWRFFTSSEWNPQTNTYGALAFIFGTLATSAIAMLIAVPLGVGTAVFLAEIASGWVRRAGSFLIELLAAIPSVVYGFWGLVFLAPAINSVIVSLGEWVPFLRGPPTGGMCILTAGLILAIMVLPYVAAISFDVCRAVPRTQADGALALGATRWRMIWSVILPYARPGIIGGCFLALGRALGETMAVTMLIGNRVQISWSVFAAGDSIASVIANQLNEAESDLQRSALVELGLILLLVTIVVNVLARLLIWRVGQVRRGSWLTGWFGSVHRTVGVDPSLNVKPAVVIPKTPRPMAGWIDKIMTWVLAGGLVVSLGPLFLILGYIFYRGVGALNWDFFTKLPEPAGVEGGGLAHAMYGSLMLVGLATLFAVPLALFAAIFLVEYRTSRLVPPVRFIGELLGGVPSIVIGIFAYALLVRPLPKLEFLAPTVTLDELGNKVLVEPFFGWPQYLLSFLPNGHFSGWAGAFALGVMMIPIVMRASEVALKLVPESMRNASWALGGSKWQTVLKVTLPAALPAIITGVFLAIARIAGETAPLLLTAYNSNYWPESPNERTPFLAYYIFYYSRSSFPDWERQAWAAALVLLAFVMFLNVGIRALTGKRVLLASRAD
jgi:phosphate transport system permease protein